MVYIHLKIHHSKIMAPPMVAVQLVPNSSGPVASERTRPNTSTGTPARCGAPNDRRILMNESMAEPMKKKSMKTYFMKTYSINTLRFWDTPLDMENILC